jgi:tRNA-specific 2-thiouridylase
MKKKVFVGISGGVDSAVAAALLLDQGYDIEGIFMKNWSGEEYGLEDQCPWKEDQETAMAVCEHLGIPFRTYNLEKEYRELVIRDFFEQYRKGNTPNPDVLCNKFIKFDAFLNRCIDNGADYIATGHYANTKDGLLYKAKDTNKDQTYFLSEITSEQLEKTLFPLGNLTKPEIRDLAKKYKLPNADRPDSQGICFIGEIDMSEFLHLELEDKQGDMIDIDTGEIVSKHNGVWFYTLGQRKGLKVGGLAEPYFVCDKDVKNNTLYVAQGKEHPSLWKSVITVQDFHFIGEEPENYEDVTAMVRYRADDTAVSVELSDDKPTVFTFKDPVWAPATGQFLVAYQEGRCLGAGEIFDVK